MDISDYNYGGYENKNNDLKQNVFLQTLVYLMI